MNPSLTMRMIGAALGIFVLAGAMAWVNHHFSFGIAGQAVAMLVIAVASVALIGWCTRMTQQAGCGGPALLRYNRRFGLFTMLYIAGLFIAVWLHGGGIVDGPAAWLTACLPSIGALGMVWTIVRYPVEEEDEYLRHRFVGASLTGMGIVLMLGTVWGFLEQFSLVPHIPAWWVLPMFAVGMGVGNITGTRRS